MYQWSNKIFSLADGNPTPATNISKLEHIVQDLVHTVNMFLALANQSLLSGGKFADAGYVSVCDEEKVNIYDGRTVTITVSEDAVLKGWWCPRTKLWRISLKAQVTDISMHTLLHNGPTRRESIHLLYNVTTSASVLNHIERLNTDYDSGEKSIFLRDTKPGVRGLIPQYSRGVPNQINVAQNNLQRKTNHLAADKREKREQEILRIRGYPEGAYVQSTPGRALHQIPKSSNRAALKGEETICLYQCV